MANPPPQPNPQNVRDVVPPVTTVPEISLSGTDTNSAAGNNPSPVTQTEQQLNASDSFVPNWIPNSQANDKVPAAPQPANTLAGLPESPSHALAGGALTGLRIDTAEGEEDEQLAEAIVEASPPWLISLVTHMVLIVVLGLIAVTQAILPSISLEASISDSFGKQLEHETFEISDTQLDDQSVLTPEDITMAEDPLASPHTTAPEMAAQLVATADFEAPNVGLALTGREQGMKETLLLAYGGSKVTEQSVYLALRWLEKQQQRDGSWRLDGPYEDASVTRNDLAATSMALLAFQGAGFTPNSTRTMITDSGGDKREVDYRRLMQRGWKKMLEWQDEDGAFWKKGRVNHPHHKLYSQAQATIAICELYGMTKDEKYRRPAQLAVNYACDIQDEDGVPPDGGWRYDPGRDSDTSVTGWFVMALQSARMAGLDVPSDVFHKISKFLDAVSDEGSYYAYMPDYNTKPTLTAEGLLCRQYLGWRKDDERLVKGVDYLARHPIDWEDTNTYYWYYATQVMHHMEGDTWFEWNDVMSQKIPAKQVKAGQEKGSWSPSGDPWGQGGGRLYMTCLCTYMLEVYYRHMPIYSKLF